MNCSNHPIADVTAYCQQCGKPLCAECARPVGGMVFCEPCLQARLGIPVEGRGPEILSGEHANPVLAAVLGFIPGVGAMYNGQLPKALAHVLIFAVFVSLSDRSVIFAMLVAGWIFYQVFDAYQTAKARRDGLPLPNPFGLNDLGTRMGISHSPAPPVVPPAAPWTPGSTSADAPHTGGEPAAQPPGVPPTSTYSTVSTYGTEVTSPPPPASKAPIGAIVLIVVGLFLLFQTLGILSGLWIGRGWPVLIIGLGVWLLYRRTHDSSRGGPQ